MPPHNNDNTRKQSSPNILNPIVIILSIWRPWSTVVEFLMLNVCVIPVAARE